jgi:hypothetical protein
VTEGRTVDELIGVYNADSGVIGELRYAARKLTGRGHCALCDITHRGTRQRPEWFRACAELSAPITLLHLNDRPEPVRAASDGAVPCLIARVGTELILVLGPADLEGCGADVDEFERRLRAAAIAHGLVLD